MSAWVCALIDDALATDDEAPEETQETAKNGTKQAFFDAVSRHFHRHVAAKKAGVSLQRLQKWWADPAFRQQVAFYEAIALERIEAKLFTKAMKGDGNVLALQTLLNAHHPKHGVIRQELLRRIVGDLHEKWGNVLRDSLGPEVANPIIDKLKGTSEKKLSQFR